MQIQSTSAPCLHRKNPPEHKFAALASQMGWFATKRGWPDFLCFTPEGELIAVEVKPRMRSRDGMKVLKRDQSNAMDALMAHGIRCFVSDGDVLEPYNPEVHADESRRYSRHRFAKQQE